MKEQRNKVSLSKNTKERQVGGTKRDRKTPDLHAMSKMKKRKKGVNITFITTLHMQSYHIESATTMAVCKIYLMSILNC